MLRINTVSILGANGNMGSSCGGLIAAFGNCQVFMVSRSIAKAKEGIAKAINSVKSDAIESNFIPLTYKELSVCIPKSQWVLEAFPEDMNIKHKINIQISKFVKPKTIISTTTSSLSINDLASDFNKSLRNYYFGTHFFNPPYKMLLCEIIPNLDSNKKIQQDLVEYLEKILLRQVIICKDIPAFLGNGIGITILNEALLYAQKFGVLYMDYLLGGIVGRILPPLQTIDLIGLDVYQAIVNDMGLVKQIWIDKLIKEQKLGNKTGSGLYKYKKNKKYYWDFKCKRYLPFSSMNIVFIEDVKEKIKEGKYREAIFNLTNSDTKEAKIIQYFFAKYIYTALSLINTVAKNIEDIDKAMAFGFNWLPPGSLIDFIGGKVNAINLLKKNSLPVPEVLSKFDNKSIFNRLQNIMDNRTFFRAT